jgi:hypothetical protein
VPSGYAPDEEARAMDSERFDRIARSFSRGRSRRQTLRALAGGAAAGAFAFGGREASARCVSFGKGCKTSTPCCGTPEVHCFANPGKGPPNTCQTCRPNGEPCNTSQPAACCSGACYSATSGACPAGVTTSCCA